MKILVLLPMTQAQKERLESKDPENSYNYTLPDSVTDEEISEAEIIIGNIPTEKLAICHKLKWLQLNSAGSDNYAPFVPENILLTNSSGAYGLAISEHMLGMLLEIKKKLYLYRDNQNKQLWQSMGTVTSVEGAVTLVVGMGDIGGSFAKKVKAMGSYVIGVKRTMSQKPDYCDELYTSEKLKELVPKADIIAISLPGGNKTDHLFNSEMLKLTKKGCVLLNVGRGSAVDTEALCDLLEEGHFEGVGLDVTDPEPLPAHHRLWNIPNAVITPHISGYFHLPKTLENIIDIATDNYERYLKGEELKNLVDRKTGYRKL